MALVESQARPRVFSLLQQVVRRFLWVIVEK